MEFINLDIIMTKVSSGLYNGKPTFSLSSQVGSPLVAFDLFPWTNFCRLKSWSFPPLPFLKLFTNFLHFSLMKIRSDV